jgi:CoA:oxalate CoA-transferase
MELSREKMDLSSPKVTPEAIADTIPALFCMTGILAAIIHREKTGQGQMIDVAQLDSMIAVFPSVVFHSMSGISFGESVKQRSLLGGTLRCKDGYVQCAIPLRRLHDRLLDALRKEVDGVEIDKEKLKDWAKLNTVDRVVEVLIKAKVPVAPILSLPAAIRSPQIKAREMIVEIEHPLIGKTKSPGFPIKFSESPGKIDMPSPLLGQHNEEVFIKLMGYSKDEIMELREEGVI